MRRPDRLRPLSECSRRRSRPVSRRSLLATSIGGMVLLFATFGVAATGGFRGYEPGIFNAATSGAVWSETFENDGVSWRPLFQESNVKITHQFRTDLFQHSGTRSEEIALQFPTSGYALFGHYVDYPILFGDTLPSVWVRADQPGITLGVLVVLPETIRKDTGTPLTLLLMGSTYHATGDWEELSFDQSLKSLLDQTVLAIRGEHQIKVDSRNAYLRQVVLFTEQKKGTSLRFQIDDLQIANHVAQSISTLEEKEQGATFTPINLLAFRYQATNYPIAAAVGNERLKKEPTEPFAIGSESTRKMTEKAERERLLANRPGNAPHPGRESLASSEAPDAPEDESIASANFRRQTERGASPNGTETDRISPAAYAADLDSAIPDAGSTIIVGSGTLPESVDQSVPFPNEEEEKFPEVRFSDRMLYVGKANPVAIRAIEYQGEPLAFLKSLKFNAVWLNSTPTRELLEEAKKVDLWLIAPPPIGQETVSPNPASGQPVGDTPYFNGGSVPELYNKVLMWNLGSDLEEKDFDQIAQRAKTIKTLDPNRRPIAANVLTGLRQYSDQAIDLLLLNRQPLLTSFEMTDYGDWLRLYPNLMTVGAPFWNRIQTEPDERLLAQCRFFGAVDDMPSIISYEQIRQQVRLSMMANSHGLLFASSAPLNGTDHQAQYRACALELINLELILIDAWFAGGVPEEVIRLDSGDLSAMLLRTNSTSLFLPLSTEENDQMVFGQAAGNSMSFVVPARDGYSADLLLPGKLRKIPSHRRAGGINLSLDEISMNSLIFLAQSNWYTRVVAEKSPKLGDRMATLAIRLAKMRLDTYRSTLAALGQLNDEGKIPLVRRLPMISLPERQASTDQVCSALDQAEDYLEQGDPAEAYLQAERALREVRLNERRLWKIGTRFDECLPVLPVSVSFSTLPAYIESFDKIASGQVRLSGQNLLVGGDMERVEDWTAGKWNRVDSPYPNVTASLKCNPVAARQGGMGLSFTVSAAEGGGPLLTERAPIRVEVPVEVQTGDLICVEGWIKITSPVQKGTDGFMIYESHGGEALAQRYYQTGNDWRHFAFYRFATYDGPMRLTFALAGYGQVYLDDVSVQTVK